MPEDRPGLQPETQGRSEMIEFADKKETDFSSIIVWIAFLVALLFAGFIWFSNNSLTKSIADKQSQKTETDATLALPDNQKVVSDVTGLKKVMSILSDASTNQDSKKKVLDDLYTYFTKDVHISTIALSEDGTVGVDATTATYRTAADFMQGLKSDSKISNLTLKAISMSADTATPANMKVSFSVSFKLDMTKPAPPVAVPTTTQGSTDTSASSGDVSGSSTDTSAGSSSSSISTPSVNSSIDTTQSSGSSTP